MSRASEVRVRRIYEAPSPEDGKRILVDRLWPRGVSRQAAQLDEWAKAVAPSDELRRWYGHDPDKFAEFKRRYASELADADHEEAWRHLVAEAAQGAITLLTATRDVDHSEAAVLAERLTAPMTGWRRDIPDDEDRPGDPVCLLRRVCQRCGSVADEDPPTTCPTCHAEMPAD
jgi:uncharacterized protein YeaO (DUF488 family)